MTKRKGKAGRLKKESLLTKLQFVQAFAYFVKQEGFAVVNLNTGKVYRSMGDYWKLYRLVKALEVAIAASAGKRVVIPQIAALEFRFSGRKYKRRVFHVSQARGSLYKRVLDDRQDLVHGIPVKNVEELIQRVSQVLPLIYTPQENLSPTVFSGARIIDADFDISE